MSRYIALSESSCEILSTQNTPQSRRGYALYTSGIWQLYELCASQTLDASVSRQVFGESTLWTRAIFEFFLDICCEHAVFPVFSKSRIRNTFQVMSVFEFEMRSPYTFVFEKKKIHLLIKFIIPLLLK